MTHKVVGHFLLVGGENVGKTVFGAKLSGTYEPSLPEHSTRTLSPGRFEVKHPPITADGKTLRYKCVLWELPSPDTEAYEQALNEALTVTRTENQNENWLNLGVCGVIAVHKQSFAVDRPSLRKEWVEKSARRFAEEKKTNWYELSDILRSVAIESLRKETIKDLNQLGSDVLRLQLDPALNNVPALFVTNASFPTDLAISNSFTETAKAFSEALKALGNVEAIGSWKEALSEPYESLCQMSLETSELLKTLGPDMLSSWRCKTNPSFAFKDRTFGFRSVPGANLTVLGNADAAKRPVSCKVVGFPVPNAHENRVPQKKEIDPRSSLSLSFLLEEPSALNALGTDYPVSLTFCVMFLGDENDPKEADESMKATVAVREYASLGDPEKTVPKPTRDALSWTLSCVRSAHWQGKTKSNVTSGLLEGWTDVINFF